MKTMFYVQPVYHPDEAVSTTRKSSLVVVFLLALEQMNQEQKLLQIH